MSRNFIVYQSRNRETGTLCQTLDTKHADSTLPMDGGRYVARCVEHDTIKRFAEHYPAGRAIAHVSEWCKPCQAMIKKGIKVVSETLATNNGSPAVGTDRHHAHDKRWNEQAKSGEQVRKNDQSKMYEIDHKSHHIPDGNKRANLDAIHKANKQRKPSAVTTRKAKRSETKFIPQLDTDAAIKAKAKANRKRKAIAAAV